jgi:3-hydroxyisobutyrate dehydrogenase-like beta-hydroxyacid dehydrogenase
MQALQHAVSVIGVGNMGGGITTNLLARGYNVHIHDIDASKYHFYQQKGALAQ